MGGTAFGDVGASLFRSKRSIGEISVESRSAKCCHFHTKMHLWTATSKLDKPAGAR